MKLLTVSQMREIEKEADANGVSYASMMENAGRGLAEWVHALGSEYGWDEVLGLVGAGNNGGDTLVALTWLAEAGWHTQACLVNRNPDDSLVTGYLAGGGRIINAPRQDDSEQEFANSLRQAQVFLDGLLGTGIRLPLKTEAAQVLTTVNTILAEMEFPAFVVAVDCPSGVNCDTGEAAPETIPAEWTLTMAAAKQGFFKMPAFEYLGDLQVIDIGLPEALPAWQAVRREVADWELAASYLPQRPLLSHKGTFGTALVIAGSAPYTGAAYLAGSAAYRIGAGLVNMAVPELLHSPLAGQLPEAIWTLLPHGDGFISDAALELVLKNLERATACLIGPGLGTHSRTHDFISGLMPQINIPTVVDADGLRLLARQDGWENSLKSTAVLTPHPGEMAALTGLLIEQIQSDREGVARKYAIEWGQVVVLKGAFTVLASPDGRTISIPVATPALAKAGSGDVLAGLIVGLMAQGVEPFSAASAGAFIHAQAGLAAEKYCHGVASVLARDVLEAVPDVLAELSRV